MDYEKKVGGILWFHLFDLRQEKAPPKRCYLFLQTKTSLALVLSPAATPDMS